MAAQAVFKIKETEDKGKEIIRKAKEESKRILAQAREDCESQKQVLLEKTLAEKQGIIQAAVDKANKQCETITAQGAAQRKKLLDPDQSKLERAIQLVMERIVSV